MTGAAAAHWPGRGAGAELRCAGRASYAQTKLQPVNQSRKTLTVGYDYNLSKRTDAYVMVMNDRITSYESGNSVGIGIRHRF